MTGYSFVLPLLAIGGGISSAINEVLQNYGVPIVAFFLVFGIAVGIIMNFDKIIDKDGNGTRKEGLINLVWIVGFVVIAIAVIAGLISFIQSNLDLSI